MAYGLNTTPGSSTARQRSRIAVLGQKKGFTVDEIRRIVGGSIRALSAAQASDWIARFDGGPLPNPPGKKPRAPYSHPQPGVTRMRTPEQVEQIRRLLAEYFETAEDRAAGWMESNFGVRDPERIDTRKRAGEIIRVLKTLTARKNNRKPLYKGKRL